MPSDAKVDVLVVGAGAFGLWAARAAHALGFSVAIADAVGPGGGASSTPVGALAPHDPGPWSSLKALQLEGLLSLADAVAELEAATASSCGYARVGRLRPVSDPEHLGRLSTQAGHAEERWRGAGRIVAHERVPCEMARHLIAPHGVVWDDLTARIDAKAYIAALDAALGDGVLRLWRWRCLSLSVGHARFDRGEVAAGLIVLAAGAGTGALCGRAELGAVKGQAALVSAPIPADTPVISGGGFYVVARGDGRVAVGSTHEPDWTSEDPDRLIDERIALAAQNVPELKSATVLSRWAGLRPRAGGAMPVVGPLADIPGVSLATGGYKIGLALGHLLGPEAVRLGLGQAPSSWLPTQAMASERLLKRS